MPSDARITNPTLTRLHPIRRQGVTSYTPASFVHGLFSTFGASSSFTHMGDISTPKHAASVSIPLSTLSDGEAPKCLLRKVTPKESPIACSKRMAVMPPKSGFLRLRVFLRAMTYPMGTR